LRPQSLYGSRRYFQGPHTRRGVLLIQVYANRGFCGRSDRTPLLRTGVLSLEEQCTKQPCRPRAAVTKRSALLAGVSRLNLVSNGKNEADVFAEARGES
jgi:hypothetical protein